VVDDPNRPVELFHNDSEHRPAVNERIWVELDDPIEATLYPVHITGMFAVSRGGAAGGDALCRVVRGHARVIALETD
jgi:hypothetical protein